MGRTRGGGGQRRCIRFESIAFFGAWGCFRGQVPILVEFFIWVFGTYWDGIRRSGGPTYRYPSTRRSRSRALLNEVFGEFFGLCVFCCLRGHTNEAFVLYFKAIAFAGSSSRNVGSGHHFYKMCYWEETMMGLYY